MYVAVQDDKPAYPPSKRPTGWHHQFHRGLRASSKPLTVAATKTGSPNLHPTWKEFTKP